MRYYTDIFRHPELTHVVNQHRYFFDNLSKRFWTNHIDLDLHAEEYSDCKKHFDWLKFSP